MSAISFPLSLKCTPRAAHAPAAWFIPGADVHVWLDEIGEWELPAHALRFYVVPVSAQDRSLIGVLVTVPADAKPRAVRRALPYGRVGGRLFLPVDAVLSPPVSDAELRQKLRLDVQVLHPSAGLVGFQSSEALAVQDLLVAPPPHETEWDRAVPAEGSRWRLLAVEPEETPGLAEMLEQGRDDIGTQTPGTLPPTADESKLKDMARRLARPPLKMLDYLSGLAGGAQQKPGAKKRAARKGVMGRMHDWTSAKLAALSASLLDARQRELERLRRMLEEDPDEALRHAIPLRALGTRGTAPPSASLGTREVNFDLNRLGGGGRPGDTWHIENDLVQGLTERYREAANRELRLARYRRAAYIFAELLADYAAAANALEQGRHYREAAALYRDHLHNQLKAAQCLEHGGLLPESAAIYRELKMFEKAGDLLRTIGHDDEAAACYREQVGVDLQRTQWLHAAELLETKLASPDEALDVLTRAWPMADTSGECLRASFELLGRLARHEETTRRIKKLRDAASAPVGRGAALTRVLADVATSYPEQNIRTLCADTTRVVGGRELADTVGGDRAAIVRAIARLVPEDRLLSRDARRFLDKPPLRPLPKALPQGRSPTIVRQFRVDDGVASVAVAQDGSGFFAITLPTKTQRHAWIIRGDWHGRLQHNGMYPPPTVPLSLHPVPGRPELILTPFVPQDLAPFEKSDVFAESVAIIRPAWLPEQGLLALAHSDRAFTWAICDIPGGSPVLNAYGTSSGALLVSHALTGLTPPNDQITMLARSAYVFATWDEALLQYGPGGLRMEAMPGPVCHLAASPSPGRFQLAVGIDAGGLLFSESSRHIPFGDDLTEPLLAFTRSGVLIAADRHVGRLYSTADGTPRRLGDFPTTQNLIAITATNQLNEFATFDSDGSVSVFRLPD